VVYNCGVPDSIYYEIPANHGLLKHHVEIILDLRINFIFKIEEYAKGSIPICKKQYLS